VDAASGPTTALLLDTLRHATGRADLGFDAPPTPLSGGFYAEMLRFRLVDPPVDLDRDLVARIVPNSVAGAWEATIQRAVADQGFSTPTVRLTAPDTSAPRRYLIVMDAVDGHPPMAGLGIGTIVGQIPGLVRHLLATEPSTTARVITHGTEAAVDDVNLAWHRKVHALRILVELAGWDANGTRPTAGHPWLIVEPVAQRELGLRR